MLLRFGTRSVLLGLMAVGVTAGCSKKSDDETTTSTGNDLANVTDASQLGVSSALKIDMPKAYDKSAQALAVTTAGKRSQEACQMGEPIKETLRSIDGIRNFFCHIEVEKDNIKFGEKTTITSNGEEFGRIWIDNSGIAEGKITLYMCEGDSLKEKIDITGVKLGADGKPKAMKGTIQQQGSEGTQSWARSVVFDKGFTGDFLEVTSKDRFQDSSNNGGTFVRQVSLQLQNDSANVSKIVLSSKGSWGGSEFEQAGMGLSAGTYGQALFKNKGSYQSQTFEFTRRSSFDADGVVVDPSVSALLIDGGSLRVAKTDLPEYLASDFAPDAPTGWDCSGVEKTVDLNPESEAHAACEGDNDEGGGASCWGDDFEEGEDVQL